MKKYLLGLLLVLALLLTLLPVAAFADEEENEYVDEAVEEFEATGEAGVWIKGVQVTAENSADILGDGKFSYDEATKTLTVRNGAKIDAED